MPIFDYRCNKCGGLYDVFHKVREVQEDVLCPSCGSHDYKKLMSLTNVAVASTASKRANACDMGDACCGGVCGVN
ncbi:MAG: zinc ribbon domain-containing protein [Ignavibacteriales bacterium]|nr:zinc ribbon domain-containing protein [Ignavibacteriales bacterium]